MKRATVILGISAAVAVGLAASAMDCDTIDSAIELVMSQYGPIGVSVRLLSVNDTHSLAPPYEWVSVSVAVAPVVPDPEWRQDTYYLGGVIQRETHEVPVGLRRIDRDLLLPCSEIVTKMPDGFRVDLASAQLFWPLVVGLDEPIWVIQWEDTVYQVGAYTGHLYVD